MAKTKTYRSKVDLWLLGVLIAGMAVAGLGAVQPIVAGTPGGWWIAIGIALIGIGLPLWILLGTYYRFEADELIVRCGPFRWRIALSEITEVLPTSNPVSSPALSLDHLKIVFGRGRTLLVSPRYKEEFRDEIERRRIVL